MEQNNSTVVRWLHLSDLHFASDPADSNMQSKLLEKLKEVTNNSPVDCIVVTGDFFDKGICDVKVKKFLEDLYQYCSEKGHWDWNKGSPMDRLFVCPGNHDLERNVGSYNKTEYLYRPEIIKELVKKDQTKDAFLDRSNDDTKDQYSLLTRQAFLQYEKEILGLLPSDKLDEYKYECIVYSLPDIITPNPVIFIGINTELYAGQIRAAKAVFEDIVAAHKEVFKHEAGLDFEAAKEAYERYMQLLGQLCIDNFADDDKRLCFISKEAQECVKQKIPKGKDPIVILFGHHSLNALTDSARIAEANFAKNYCSYSKLYLCGHSHKLGREIIGTSLIGDTPYEQYQTCVGGVFADSSGYNDFSFSIGTIQWSAGIPLSSETLYLWTKNRIDGSYSWITHKPPCISNLTSLPSPRLLTDADKQIDVDVKQEVTENLQRGELSATDDIQNKDMHKTTPDPARLSDKDQESSKQKTDKFQAPRIPDIPI